MLCSVWNDTFKKSSFYRLFKIELICNIPISWNVKNSALQTFNLMHFESRQHKERTEHISQMSIYMLFLLLMVNTFTWNNTGFYITLVQPRFLIRIAIDWRKFTAKPCLFVYQHTKLHLFVDTGGKFATGVVNPVVRISPRIFETIWNGPNGISGAGGKLIHEKTRRKNLVTLSL